MGEKTRTEVGEFRIIKREEKTDSRDFDFTNEHKFVIICLFLIKNMRDCCSLGGRLYEDTVSERNDY